MPENDPTSVPPADHTADEIAARLKRRLREVLRASPALWQEFRRAKKARRPSIPAMVAYAVVGLVIGPIMLLVWPLSLIHLLHGQLGTDLFLGFVSLLATGGTFLFASTLLTFLRQSRPLSVLSHLPADDAEVARTVWGTCAGGAVLTLYFVGLPYGYVAWTEGFSLPGWLLALGLALVQWLVIVALGTLLAVSRPRWPFGAFLVATVFAIGWLLIMAIWQPLMLRPQLTAEVLFRAVPAGWVSGVLGQAWIGGAWRAWLGLVPVVLMAAVLAPTVRRLATAYKIREYSFRPDAEAAATVVGWLSPDGPFLVESAADRELLERQSTEHRLDGLMAEQQRPATAAEAEANIRSRSFLSEPEWTRSGWIERAAALLLSQRERSIIDFVSGGRPVWTQTWAGLLMMLSIAIMADRLGLVGNWIITMVAGYGSLVIVMQGPWPGFRWRNCAGTFVAQQAILPIGYRETARAMFKVGLVRCLFVLPVLVLAALYVSRPLNVPLIEGLGVAAGLTAVLVLLQPWVITFGVSNNMRLPPLQSWWSWLYWLPPVLLAFGAVAGLGVSQVVVFAGGAAGAGLHWLAVGGALLIGTSFGIDRYFGWLDRRGKVDRVVGRVSQWEQNMVTAQEKAERQRLRGRVLREHFGPLWWLRPGTRRWARQAD